MGILRNPLRGEQKDAKRLAKEAERQAKKASREAKQQSKMAQRQATELCRRFTDTGPYKPTPRLAKEAAPPEEVIAAAKEIDAHFSNTWGREPADEVGKCILDVLVPRAGGDVQPGAADLSGDRPDTFEWLVLMLILDMNGLYYDEYFPALRRSGSPDDPYESAALFDRKAWAVRVLEHSEGQMNPDYKKLCDDTIRNLTASLRRDLSFMSTPKCRCTHPLQFDTLPDPLGLQRSRPKTYGCMHCGGRVRGWVDWPDDPLDDRLKQLRRQYQVSS